MRRFRPYYVRLLVIVAAAGLLTVQANTYRPGPPVIHSTRAPYRPPVCKHGTVPDLDPHSFDFGMPVCAK